MDQALIFGNDNTHVLLCKSQQIVTYIHTNYQHFENLLLEQMVSALERTIYNFRRIYMYM